MVISNSNFETSCEIKRGFLKIPSITVVTKIKNLQDIPVTILFQKIKLNVVTGGQGCDLGSKIDMARFETINYKDTARLEMVFEFGFDKLSLIERNQHGDLYFNVKPMIGIVTTENPVKFSIVEFAEYQAIVPQSDWINWRHDFAGQFKIIPVNLDIETTLSKMIIEFGAYDYESLFYRIFDLLRSVDDSDKKIQYEFVTTEMGGGSFKKKIEEMLNRANITIFISAFLDSSLFEILKRKATEGVKILVLTSDIEAIQRSPKGVKQTVPELRTFCEVKTNNKRHSRLIIVDEQEAIISSGDLTSYSLNHNFESGIYTNNEGIVKQSVNFFYKMWNDDNSKQISQINE